MIFIPRRSLTSGHLGGYIGYSVCEKFFPPESKHEMSGFLSRHRHEWFADFIFDSKEPFLAKERTRISSSNLHEINPQNTFRTQNFSSRKRTVMKYSCSESMSVSINSAPFRDIPFSLSFLSSGSRTLIHTLLLESNNFVFFRITQIRHRHHWYGWQEWLNQVSNWNGIRAKGKSNLDRKGNFNQCLLRSKILLVRTVLEPFSSSFLNHVSRWPPSMSWLGPLLHLSAFPFVQHIFWHVSFLSHFFSLFECIKKMFLT